MENLTNEQIIDIINFYKQCGISEDMYLSNDGVLDLFTLLGIKPEYDESGERIPTVYEQLGIAPIFRDKKEVPIVFAIKHKISKIHKQEILSSKTFAFKGAKELTSEDAILLKFRQDYFSSFYSGNLAEATRLYDIIDILTGGNADKYIGIQFNAVKFYKKMKQQLLIDMFANFVILMVLSKASNIKQGIVQYDKLYKSFMKQNYSKTNLGFNAGSVGFPKLDNISISVDNGDEPKKINIMIKSPKNKHTNDEKQVFSEENKQSEIKSTIKLKVNEKIKKAKTSFIYKIFGETSQNNENVKNELVSKNSEISVNILEND